MTTVRFTVVTVTFALILGNAAGARSATSGSPRQDPVVPIATDLATSAGIAQTSVSFDAVVGDYNNDGWPDFLTGHHGTAPAQLFINGANQTFSEVDPGTFVQEDRHDCAAADVNGDGMLDVACGHGADHGVGMKANDLWIQGAGLTFTNQGIAGGIADPFGRGRQPLFFDANGDGLPDLFITNDIGRPDGYPGPDRFFLNGGGGVFTDAPSFGLDVFLSPKQLGTGCVQAADVNGDGWLDLLICANVGLHVFLNQGGTHFDDASAALGLTAADNPSGAVLVDVNGDGLLDLVDVTSNALNIRLQQAGTFQPRVNVAALTSGAEVAAGDVNGDGTPDLYVVQSGSTATGNDPDLLLLNGSAGTVLSFTPMPSLPQVTTGVGQSAFPLDYDHNGLTDFLVLNGQGTPGPLQLIAFALSSQPRHGVTSGAARHTVAGSSFLAGPKAPCGPAFGTVATPSAGGATRFAALAGVTADAWGVGTAAGNAALTEHWNGKAWSISSTPALTGQSGLNDLTGLAMNDVWAVGYQSVGPNFQTASEHWNGSAWVLKPTVNPPGSGADVLIGSGGSATNDVWAVGYQTLGSATQPLIERWDGTGWSVIQAGLGGAWDRAELLGIAMASASDGWAVGWSETAGYYQALLERWDGTTWSIVSAPPVAAEGDVLTAIAQDATGDIWAVGYQVTGSRFQTLVERWDGTAWAIAPTVDPGTAVDFLRGLTVISDRNAWAVGADLAPSGAFEPLIEHWDGTAWSTFQGAISGDSPLSAAASFNGSDIWAGGEGTSVEHLCPIVVDESGFSSAASNVTPGLSVLWTVSAAATTSHSITDGSPLGLFDSGPLLPGSTYTMNYPGAGTFPVTDTTDGKGMQIRITMVASPPSGSVGSTLALTWAGAPAPVGFDFDVQIKSPGSSTWTDWMPNTTLPGASFVPSVAGTYRFRTRVESTVTGLASAYSPAKSINVTA